MRHIIRDFVRSALRPKTVELSCSNLLDYVTVAEGTFSPSKLTLFSIFRDEIYFCRAFFDHYRSIGVEQFLILDDGSADGTEDFLRGQNDCVTLTSSLSFGQSVRCRMPNRVVQYTRAGIAFKTLIPHHFLMGTYGLYADADEFLFLPKGVPSLSALVARMEQYKTHAIIGPLIEFFPANFPVSNSQPIPPTGIDQLLSENPYFEASPLLILDPERGFRKIGRTKSELLFDRFGVKGKKGTFGRSGRPKSPSLKTPIMRHGQDAFRLGSHSVNVPASTEIMLPMAHFVFTSNFGFKVQRARKLRSHARRSAKYDFYKELADKVNQTGDGIIGTESRKFRSPQDLIDSENMKWPSIN